MKNLILSLGFILALNSLCFAKEKLTTTENTIHYVGWLLEKGMIEDQDLLRFYRGLEKGELHNPIDERNTYANIALYHHFAQLKKDFSDLGHEHDLEELLRWTETALEERKVRWEKSDRMREETKQLRLKDLSPGLALGFRHTCAIDVDQRVKCWGNNSHKQSNDTMANSKIGASSQSMGAHLEYINFGNNDKKI